MVSIIPEYLSWRTQSSLSNSCRHKHNSCHSSFWFRCSLHPLKSGDTSGIQNGVLSLVETILKKRVLHDAGYKVKLLKGSEIWTCGWKFLYFQFLLSLIFHTSQFWPELNLNTFKRMINSLQCVFQYLHMNFVVCIISIAQCPQKLLFGTFVESKRKAWKNQYLHPCFHF